MSDIEVPKIHTLIIKASTSDLKLSLRLAPPVGSSSRNILDTTLQRLRTEARNAEKNDSRMLWRKFFLIRDAFASLGPAAVLTVHRSQGSTFGDVFVASDVFWPKDLVLRRQLVYVAVSRAMNGVWMIGKDGLTSKQSIWQEQLQS